MQGVNSLSALSEKALNIIIITNVYTGLKFNNYKIAVINVCPVKRKGVEKKFTIYKARR